MSVPTTQAPASNTDTLAEQIRAALDLDRLRSWLATKADDEPAGQCGSASHCVLAQYLLETIPGAVLASVGIGNDPDAPDFDQDSPASYRGDAMIQLERTDQYHAPLSATVLLPLELDRLAHRFDDLPGYARRQDVPASVVRTVLATLDQPKPYPSKSSTGWPTPDEDTDDADAL